MNTLFQTDEGFIVVEGKLMPKTIAATYPIAEDIALITNTKEEILQMYKERQIEELIKSKLLKQYIDYGDLNYKAEEQLFNFGKECYKADKAVYTESDLQAAFEAGKDFIKHEWHMDEFHGTSCKCKAPEIQSFMDLKEFLQKEILPIECEVEERVAEYEDRDDVVSITITKLTKFV